jgi:O-antigen/teichoic acid export membrane protein
MRFIAVRSRKRRSLFPGATVNMQGPASNSNGVDHLDPSRGNILGNAFWLSAGDVVSRIIAFGGTAYLTRQLGPAGFGVIGFAIALASYFKLVATGGSDSMASREVARRPNDVTEIAVSVILVRVVLAFLAMAAMAMIAWWIDKPLATRLVIALSGLSFLSLAIDTAWAFKGLERNGPIAISMVLGQTLFVILVLLFVRKPDDVVFVPVAQFLGEFVGASLLVVLILRLGRVTWHFGEGIRVLRSSGNLLASKILRTLIFNFDVLLIGFMLGEKQVGLYVAPYRFCFVLLAIAMAIHASYLPAFVRAASKGPDTLAEVTNRALGFSAAVGAPLVIGGMVVAAPLLCALFGPPYVEGTTAFRLLILSIGPIFLHGHLHNLLLALDRTSIELRIVAAATTANIVLNLLLIPLWGIAGAAVNTVAAEGLILLLMLLVVRRKGGHFFVGTVGRPLLAAAAMGAALLGLRTNDRLLLSVTLGAAIYVVALFLFRGVPEDIKLHLHKDRMDRAPR